MIKLPKNMVLKLESAGTDRFWHSDEGLRIYEEEVIPYGIKADDQDIFVSPNKRVFSGIVRIKHTGSWMTCSFKKAKISKESMKAVLNKLRAPKPKPPEPKVMRADEVPDIESWSYQDYRAFAQPRRTPMYTVDYRTAERQARRTLYNRTR